MKKGMMPVVNNLHYNFIMTGRLSEERTVFAEERFSNLFDVFETLLNWSGIRNTRVSIYQSGTKKTKHGRIRWDKEGLLRIVTEEDSTPLMLIIEAPSSKARSIMDIHPFMLEQDTPDMNYVFQSWTRFSLPQP